MPGRANDLCLQDHSRHKHLEKAILGEGTNHVIWTNSLTKKYNLQKVTQNLKQKDEITSYQVNKSTSCQGAIKTPMRAVLQLFGMGETLKSVITSQDTDCR